MTYPLCVSKTEPSDNAKQSISEQHSEPYVQPSGWLFDGGASCANAGMATKSKALISTFLMLVSVLCWWVEIKVQAIGEIYGGALYQTLRKLLSTGHVVTLIDTQRYLTHYASRPASNGVFNKEDRGIFRLHVVNPLHCGPNHGVDE